MAKKKKQKKQKKPKKEDFEPLPSYILKDTDHLIFNEFNIKK